jgi:hypothetical protein
MVVLDFFTVYSDSGEGGRPGYTDYPALYVATAA